LGQGSAHPPRSIGDTRGYHANPAFDPSGEWVYFAHNPDAVGLPMRHIERAYAQIYRVHLDGSELQKLTNERGCHFAPAPGKNGKLLFVHTQCHGYERSLVRMTLADASESTLKLVGDANETALSDDGRKLLYVVNRSGLASLFELDVETGASKLIDEGAVISGAEPRFGIGRQIYYVLNDALWSARAGHKRRILSLQAGPR
jgi:Tol biopolymer transport system component